MKHQKKHQQKKKNKIVLKCGYCGRRNDSKQYYLCIKRNYIIQCDDIDCWINSGIIVEERK